jgi:hypothetical protein
MTNQCTRCTYELEDGAVVCIHCGAALGEPAGPDAARSSVASDLSDPPVATREATPATPAQPVIASPMFSTGSDLNGIGGWLILVAIGLAISPFIMMHGVYTDLRILTGDRYQAGLALRPGLAGLVMFEAITNTLFLAAVVCLNVLLYQRKRVFPTAMVVYFSAQIVWVLIDHLMTLKYTPHSTWTGVLRAIVAGLIWIPYFLQSRRVEVTFVHE